MKEKLGLDDDFLNLIVDAGFYSLNELSRIHGKCQSEIAVNIGISKDCLEGIVERAREEINHSKNNVLKS